MGTGTETPKLLKLPQKLVNSFEQVYDDSALYANCWGISVR